MLSVQNKARLLSFSQVEEHFRQSKFIFWENYAKVLYQSWLSGRNLIVYGKGGYGKSEMTLHFFALLEQVIPDFSADILDCGGADSTKIWGGLDASALPNFIYNLNKSWLSKKYVIFEELFDAMLSALVETKYTLTSGEYRSPLQTYKAQTEWLICLTNKSKTEVLDSVGEDSRNTVDALLQRFPLSYQLEWSREQLHNPTSWETLLQKARPRLQGDVRTLFSTAIAQCHRKYKATHDYMSPRSVLHLLHTTEAWAHSTGKPLTLQHFLDLAWAYPEPAQEFFKSEVEYWNEDNVEELTAALEDIKSQIVALDLPIGQLRAKPRNYIEEINNKVRELCRAFPEEDELSSAWECIRECYYGGQ